MSILSESVIDILQSAVSDLNTNKHLDVSFIFVILMFEIN